MKIRFENLDEVILACIASAEHFGKLAARIQRARHAGWANSVSYQEHCEKAEAFKYLADAAHCEKRFLAQIAKKRGVGS